MEKRPSNLDRPIKLFFDIKLTGQEKLASVISISIMTLTGIYFYAEFNDYSKRFITKEVKKNCLSDTKFIGKVKSDKSFLVSTLPTSNMENTSVTSIEMYGSIKEISKELDKWLKSFGCNKENVELFCYNSSYQFPFLIDILRKKDNNSENNEINLPNISHDLIYDISLYFGIPLENVISFSLHNLLKNYLKEDKLQKHNSIRRSLFSVEKRFNFLRNCLLLREVYKIMYD